MAYRAPIASAPVRIAHNPVFTDPIAPVLTPRTPIAPAPAPTAPIAPHIAHDPAPGTLIVSDQAPIAPAPAPTAPTTHN